MTSIAKLSFITENSTHNIPEMKFGHVTLDHRRQKIIVACIVPISSSEACFEKIVFSVQSRSQFGYSYSSVNLLIFSFGYLLTACLFNMSSKADRWKCRHSHYFLRNGSLPEFKYRTISACQYIWLSGRHTAYWLTQPGNNCPEVFVKQAGKVVITFRYPPL